MKKFALVAIAGIFAISSPAMAWKAYHLEGNKYAILCADGAIFTYSGSGSGLSISGDALCKDHGGVAGGGPTGGVKKAKKVNQPAVPTVPAAPTAHKGGYSPTGSVYKHQRDTSHKYVGPDVQLPGATAADSASNAAKARAGGYKHRPDSTQYHPGGKAGEGATGASGAAPKAGAAAYIHRPDSTQYHPGGGVGTAASSAAPAPSAAPAAYIHRPDSTQYHPGGGTATPAEAAYIHRPDSTQYHPGDPKSSTDGGITAEDDWATPTTGADYRHRDDSTQYRPGDKKK